MLIKRLRMLKLDIGCGPYKRPDFVGVDVAGEPDVLCDIARDRLPFEDSSADHVYSAHCLEHIEQRDLLHVFQEMTRVCTDGGLLEIWHPHAAHSDAFVLGHINYLGEAIYDHLGCSQRDFWRPFLGGTQWILEEIRYGVDRFVLEDIEAAGMNIDFAVSYLREVIREIGVFVRVDRTGCPGPRGYSRSVCAMWNRYEIVVQLSDGPRQTALAPR
jgi:SAM-dependent methyltransferase